MPFIPCSKISEGRSAHHLAMAFIAAAECSITKLKSDDRKSMGKSAHKSVAPTAIPHRKTIKGPATMPHSEVSPKSHATSGIVAAEAVTLTMTLAKNQFRMYLPQRLTMLARKFVEASGEVYRIWRSRGVPHSTMPATARNESRNPASCIINGSHNNIIVAARDSELSVRVWETSVVESCRNENIVAARTIEGEKPTIAAYTHIKMIVSTLRSSCPC